MTYPKQSGFHFGNASNNISRMWPFLKKTMITRKKRRMKTGVMKRTPASVPCRTIRTPMTTMARCASPHDEDDAKAGEIRRGGTFLPYGFFTIWNENYPLILSVAMLGGSKLALALGLLNVRFTDSSLSSSSLSVTAETLKVLLVSPGRNVSVPDACT